MERKCHANIGRRSAGAKEIAVAEMHVLFYSCGVSEVVVAVIASFPNVRGKVAGRRCVSEATVR